jgi:hypothetical protein
VLHVVRFIGHACILRSKNLLTYYELYNIIFVPFENTIFEVSNDTDYVIYFLYMLSKLTIGIHVGSVHRTGGEYFILTLYLE